MTTLEKIEALLRKYYFLAQGPNHMFWMVGLITDQQFFEICQSELCARDIENTQVQS